MRLFRLSAVCSVIAASIVAFGAAPANAGDLCEQVWIGGEWVIPQSYTWCEPYAGTLCAARGVGAEPQIVVYVDACVPDPVATP